MTSDFRICESDITSIYVDGSCWEFRVNEDHGTIVDMNHEETISAEWRSEKMAVPEWPQLFARKYNNSGQCYLRTCLIKGNAREAPKMFTKSSRCFLETPKKATVEF